eukprot:2227764-Rhodomonas_salina.1
MGGKKVIMTALRRGKWGSFASGFRSTRITSLALLMMSTPSRSLPALTHAVQTMPMVTGSICPWLKSIWCRRLGVRRSGGLDNKPVARNEAKPIAQEQGRTQGEREERKAALSWEARAEGADGAEGEGWKQEQKRESRGGLRGRCEDATCMPCNAWSTRPCSLSRRTVLALI